MHSRRHSLSPPVHTLSAPPAKDSKGSAFGGVQGQSPWPVSGRSPDRSLAPRFANGATNCGSVSHGNRIQVSCDTSVMNDIHHPPPIRLGVHGGEMRARQQGPHDARGRAGIHQIVDDQKPGAIACRAGGLITTGAPRAPPRLASPRCPPRRSRSKPLHQPHIQLARDDRRRDQPAAGDRDDAARTAPAPSAARPTRARRDATGPTITV